MPTATRITTANIAIGPQLRPWLTLTGAIGRRPPPFTAGREPPALAALAAGRPAALAAEADLEAALEAAALAPVLEEDAVRPAAFEAGFDSSLSRFGLPPAVALVADDRRDPPLCGVLMLMGLVRRGSGSGGLHRQRAPVQLGNGAPPSMGVYPR